MESLILLDSSILIEYFRKTKKENSFLISLIKNESSFAASVITEFEIFIGSKDEHRSFWNQLFTSFLILPLDSICIKEAVNIQNKLKTNRQQIDFPDLLIAATAVAYDLPLATLNKKHFERIKVLNLITP